MPSGGPVRFRIWEPNFKPGTGLDLNGNKMKIQELISKKGYQLRMNLTNGRIGSYSAVKNGRVYATEKTQTQLLKKLK
jgi:hypothetical protein